MWFTSDREQIRSLFYQSWRKYRSSQPLEPLEAVIVYSSGDRQFQAVEE